MISAVPYLPSAEWYARFLRSRFRGATYPSVARKDCCRTLIRGNGAPLMLSIPVCGGAAALKRTDFGDLVMSEHGRWRHQHLGAIEAAYGRTPFFIHLFPLICEVMEGETRNLARFNILLSDRLRRFMRLDGIFGSSGLPDPADIGHKEILERRAREIEAHIDMRLSLLDVAFRLGPEGALPLALGLQANI